MKKNVFILALGLTSLSLSSFEAVDYKLSSEQNIELNTHTSFDLDEHLFELFGRVYCDNLAKETFRNGFKNGHGLDFDLALKAAKSVHGICMEDENGWSARGWEQVEKELTNLYG